jgi:2-dehydro-3-deoxyphosphogluconate aldolase/(4S)-4-hydroxy-2-oxoglutarate aldolase
MPGAFTPTEVVTAFEAGADVVKVFPCDVGGPGYLKALHGPLPHIPLLPTGGVGLENAAEYLQAGAFALGVGGSLVESRTVEQRDFARIEELARRFRSVVTQVRGS